MIRMLPANDLAELFGSVIVGRRFAWQIGDGDHPVQSRLDPELAVWNHQLRPVERAGCDFDFRSADFTIAKGRAAGRAEVAFSDGG